MAPNSKPIALTFGSPIDRTGVEQNLSSVLKVPRHCPCVLQYIELSSTAGVCSCRYVEGNREHVFTLVMRLMPSGLMGVPKRTNAYGILESRRGPGGGGFGRADHATPLYPHKLALNFVDQWWSLIRFSSLAD
jgi:hypothetical protein